MGSKIYTDLSIIQVYFLLIMKYWSNYSGNRVTFSFSKPHQNIASEFILELVLHSGKWGRKARGGGHTGGFYELGC